MNITKYKTVLNEDRIQILVKESAKRYDTQQFNSSESIVKMMNSVYSANIQTEEYAWIVAMGNKNNIKGIFEISHGTMDSSLINPREIFSKILLIGAASFVFVHNHPSGDSTPSKADADVTERLSVGAKLLGINMLDHIIIGSSDSDYTSFAQKNLMKNLSVNNFVL